MELNCAEVFSSNLNFVSTLVDPTSLNKDELQSKKLKRRYRFSLDIWRKIRKQIWSKRMFILKQK